jgi:hypothetical protein
MSGDDTDYVLLYIDNCQPAFTDILLFVNKCQLKKWKARARAIRTHVRRETLRVMKFGLQFYAGRPDPESAMHLSTALGQLDTDTDAYWRGVFDYYKQKLQENGVPQEDPEKRAAWEKEVRRNHRKIQQDADIHALLYAAGSLGVFGS